MWKFDKLEAFLSKKKNIGILYGIVIIGVLLMAFGDFKPSPQETEKPETVSAAEAEEALRKILSSIKGVGKVQVAVTFDTGAELVPIENTRGGEETAVILGSGKDAEVAAKKEILPRVRGVIVVAEGGGNQAVRANILAAVRTLYDVPLHSVAVFAAK